jgi:galactokinase/mevalonate kinase-like predicted kinase
VTPGYSPDLRCHLKCWSDIPFQAGLSGSTAMVVAGVAALLHHRRQKANLYYLAELARSVELNHLNIVCGYQDQYMAAFGGLNYMDFRDKEFYREVFSEPFASVESLVPHCAAMPPVILAHTGVRHNSGAVHRPIRERWLDGERAVRDAYVRVARLARDGKKAILAGDWNRLGAVMNENHEIQRGLGGSGPENERLVAAALEAGAIAAKLAGAGNGGTIIALHPRPTELAEPLLAAGAHRILYVQPAPGVRREPDPS